MRVLSKEEIAREVRRLGDLQPWWHDIELPYSIWTIGRSETELEANHNVAKWRRIKELLNVERRSVLDLGCNEGFYCHEMLAAGASRVVGVDVNVHRIEKARFVAEVLNLDTATFLRRNVYELNAEEVGGRCDLVLALGLLHRVPDPYGLIMKIGDLGSAVVFEWVAVDSDKPIMCFWGGGFKDYDRDNTGYWKLSRRCLKEMLFRAGFDRFCDIGPTGARAILAAKKGDAPDLLRAKWERLDATGAVVPGAKPLRAFARITRRIALLVRGR